MPIPSDVVRRAATMGGTVIAHGLGPLTGWAIEVDADDLVVTAPDNTVRRLPTGSGSGQVARISLVTTPVWPIWWLGWGPARWCDLHLSPVSGQPLAVLPAGGGWVETARIARRFAYPFYPSRERLPRLIPGWSRAEVEAVAASSGVDLDARESKTGQRIVTALSDAQATWA